MNQQPHRVGSALLLVISMIVLMVTVATAFMSAMSRQRGTALLLASRSRAEVGMAQAQDRIIKQLLESYVTEDYSIIKHAGGANPVSGLSNCSAWFRDNAPVNDPDGNLWTDDGIPMGTGYNKASSLDRNIVNLRGVDLPDMIGMGTSDWRRNYHGLIHGDERARWHNLDFFNDDFMPIEISETLSETQKADLRASARYVLRYATQILDYSGNMCINNNFPGAPIQPDPSDQTNYNRYQAYLAHYGRSIKSMTSMARASKGRQYRSNDGSGKSVTFDPLDFEEAALNGDGEPFVFDNDNEHYIIKRDVRKKREHAFRGDSLCWVEDVGSKNLLNENETFDTLTPHLRGGHRLFTWAQIGRHHIGDDGVIGGYYIGPMFMFTPFGLGMLGAELGGTDDVSVPWRVNYLTCTKYSLTSMLGGLSSHIKIGKKFKYARSTTDLMGHGYPEAFPLGFEDGKDIPLVGEIDASYWAEYDQHQKFKGGGRVAAHGSILEDQPDSHHHPAYRHSYWTDIFFAHGAVRQMVDRLWISRGTTSTFNMENVEDYFYNRKNPFDNTNYDPTYLSNTDNDPEVMLNKIIMETCRILGEGYIKPHTSVLPATSWNRWDNTVQSLLGGAEAYVGLGLSEPNWRQNAAKKCRLSSTANTRAMEYTLNDVLISLYGKANPHYDSSVDGLDKIAVDFNNDGYAESTVTGWYNSATGQRVWSYWCNGVGPFGKPTASWMTQPTWIRFYQDGTIKRKIGGRWMDLTASEANEFKSVFNVWVNESWAGGPSAMPLKPFSHTGRFYIGKSKVFHAFVRSEVFNISNRSLMSSVNRGFVYTIDPNNDGNLSDSHVIVQKEFEMKPSQYD